MRRFFGPGLVLFFLAPVIGEMTCGNTPPRMFFNPLAIVLLGILYGGGAILVREAVLRWHKGWPSLLVLGAAYAWVEEALMVKTYFNPQGAPGYLGSYGRWLDVNWIWALDLTFYHAIYSIAVSVILVELMFPARRAASWVPRWVQVVLGVLLTIEVVLGYLFFGAEGVENAPPIARHPGRTWAASSWSLRWWFWRATCPPGERRRCRTPPCPPLARREPRGPCGSG
jgi:hypothetical protein